MRTSKKCFLTLLYLAPFLLSACGSRFLLEITDISVSPDPVVGQVVTLHIEVMSTQDEPDATIFVELPEGVKLVEGELTWNGSLVANQPQTHEVSICVLYEGEWRLWIETYSRLSETSTYVDAEILNIQSTAETARVILGRDYQVTQPPSSLRIGSKHPYLLVNNLSRQMAGFRVSCLLNSEP
ncbi:MAG: hypothetical protein ACREBU_11515 [Nitrososphaera sp.]